MRIGLAWEDLEIQSLALVSRKNYTTGDTRYVNLNGACNKADTDAAKRQVIAGRTVTNFELTADAVGAAGKLHAEHILNEWPEYQSREWRCC